MAKTVKPECRKPPGLEKSDSGGLKRLLIINPHAGAADEGFDVQAVAKRLQPCEARQTHQAGQAGALAKEARRHGFAQIVVAGGDGTINEVVNGLAPDFDQLSVGIIPLGTGNDLARSLGIPIDAQQAADIVLNNSSQRIDVVHFRGGKSERYFVNASAAGFSGSVSENTDPQSKARWGPFAYFLSAAATLGDLTKYRLSLMLDDRPLSIEAYSMIVANGQTVAGGICVAPNAQLNDGRIDVVIVPATSWTDTAVAVKDLLFGRHAYSDRMIMTQTRRLVVDSEPSLSMNLDGEVLKEDHAQFEVRPQALNVIVGPHPQTFSGSSPGLP